MRDWEAIKLYTGLAEEIQQLQPVPDTDEAWNERQLIIRMIWDKRKEYVDSAYKIYLLHNRKPWCDECDQPVVFSEFHGWHHTVPPKQSHSIHLRAYHAGTESEIIKRLRFEI